MLSHKEQNWVRDTQSSGMYVANSQIRIHRSALSLHRIGDQVHDQHCSVRTDPPGRPQLEGDTTTKLSGPSTSTLLTGNFQQRKRKAITDTPVSSKPESSIDYRSAPQT